MKLYLYDWDGTIYDGDSSADFFKFCLKKDKKLFFHLFKCVIPFIKHYTNMIDITEFKEIVFSFLKTIDNIDLHVEEFWELNKHKIKDFYLRKDHSKDIIISASPEFLLKPICDELKVKDMIASDVDKKTGKFNKPNCRGEEKVIEFRKKYKDAIIMEMYSDSIHDKPLLDLAIKSYILVKDNIYDYEVYKPSFFKNLYYRNEEIWNYLIVGILTTVVSILTYALFSRPFKLDYVTSTFLSWIFAVTFAFFTNRRFVFKSKGKKINEFIAFSSSRVLTLVLEVILMIILVSWLKLYDFLAKLIVQVAVTIANYVISKFFVFKKSKFK